LLPYAALVAGRAVLFDNSALVGYRTNELLPNPKAGLRPVAEMIRDGKDYEITLETDVPAWGFRTPGQAARCIGAWLGWSHYPRHQPDAGPTGLAARRVLRGGICAVSSCNWHLLSRRPTANLKSRGAPDSRARR